MKTEQSFCAGFGGPSGFVPHRLQFESCCMYTAMSVPIGVMIMFPVSSEAFTKGNMMQTEQKFVYLWVVYN